MTQVKVIYLEYSKKRTLSPIGVSGLTNLTIHEYKY